VALNQVVPPDENLQSLILGLATGAGVYCSNAIIEYSTIASNIVEDRGTLSLPEGLANIAGIFSSNGTVNLHGVILSNEGTNGWGDFIDGGYNLSSDDTVTLDHPTSRSEIDARLGAFEMPDGFLGYFVPLPESPALDSADPIDFPSTDLRGVIRPYALRPDIGAIERTAEPTLAVSREADHLVLSLQSVFELPITVEASTNLTAWTALQTIAPNETISIPLPQDSAIRFYRARQDTR
jgi:hypothetical protein